MIDAAKLAQALQSKGIDLRHWCSYATVGTVDDAGRFDPTDGAAVVVAPDNVWADVLLMPILIPLTCRVSLGCGGTAHIQAPIFPGDEVLVHLADGDLMQPPVISAILNSQGAKLPLDNTRRPIFKNDRLLIQCGKTLPIEVNAKRINLGSETAAEPFVLGNTALAEMASLLNALKVDIRPSPVGPIYPSPALTQAIDLWIQRQRMQVSDCIFGQKAPP